MLNGESKWNDVTEQFKDACGALKVGELLHDNNFGLFEAMSAFEMMDPKMDSGMLDIVHEQMKKSVTELKYSGFTYEEMLPIFDGTICCVTSWLEGGSMAQTVFTNLYLHDPSKIEDRVLKAFCVGVLKLVAICKEVITTTAVYEDEHFQPSAHGFHLADSISEQRTLGMLKEAEDDLSKCLRHLRSNLQSESPTESDSKELSHLERLLTRLRILKLLISCLLALRYSGTQMTSEALRKNIEKLQDLVKSVIEESKAELPVNPLDLPSFDITVTSRLLPPSFPRAIQLMSLQETMNMLAVICDHLQLAVTMPTITGLVGVMDFFDKFTANQNPSILVRSVLLYHYMPTGTNKVFNKTKLSELILDELRSFSCPPVVNPAFKSVLATHEHYKLVLPAFLASSSHVLENLLAAKCNTRARQRERLAFLLEELGVLQVEAERVDTVIDSIIREKLGEKALTHVASGVGTWTLYLTTRCMVNYLVLGMELELYDVREYGYVFWYLSEVLLLWNTSSLFRADKSLAEPNFMDSKSGSGKKKGKQKKPKSVINIHQDELLLVRCMQHLCGGLHRLLTALKMAAMLPTTGDYKFDNELVRYSHRFSPFAAVHFPQLVSYEAYVKAVGVTEDTPPYVTVDFLRQSYSNFETCRSVLDNEAGKRSKEAAAMLNVAKNNLVVTKILADSLQKEVKRKVKFDFSAHKVFPMIKFVT